MKRQHAGFVRNDLRATAQPRNFFSVISQPNSGQMESSHRSRFKNRPRISRSAFTLLETMLALSLSAMLLAGIYAAIDQSWKVSASGREEMERAQLARALIHKIEVDIRAITFVPPPPVDPSADDSSSSSTSSSGSGGSGGSGSGGSGGGGGGGGSGGGSGGGGKSGGSGKSGGGGGKSGGSSGSSGSSSSSSSFGMAASQAASTSSTTSTTATDTETTGPNSKSLGVRGTTQKLEISIARPRRDLLPGTQSTATSSQTSDLRQVSYTFLPPGSGTASGLVRIEGDRMAVEVAEAGGGSAAQMSTMQLVAPEVTAFQIRYFDGRTWSEMWDTETMTTARIPRAIEVSFAFPPPKRPRSIFSTGVSSSMNKFRTVILIPVSDPYPQDFVQ